LIIGATLEEGVDEHGCKDHLVFGRRALRDCRGRVPFDAVKSRA
jgi:hypothetical protein